jgi:hypothetical protein
MFFQAMPPSRFLHFTVIQDILLAAFVVIVSLILLFIVQDISNIRLNRGIFSK